MIYKKLIKIRNKFVESDHKIIESRYEFTSTNFIVIRIVWFYLQFKPLARFGIVKSLNNRLESWSGEYLIYIK